MANPLSYGGLSLKLSEGMAQRSQIGLWTNYDPLLMKKKELLIRSVMSGICISLGGAINVKAGGTVGAVLFAFGLLSVLQFKLPLYTGMAGFVKTMDEHINLCIVLLGNVIGCIVTSVLLGRFPSTESIISSRIDAGFLQCFLAAILCGCIMTLAVKAGREGNLLLVIFGIPLFILAGFYHSIADAFYISCVPDMALEFIPYWVLIVSGNYVGCNIPRILDFDKQP